MLPKTERVVLLQSNVIILKQVLTVEVANMKK